MGYFLENTSEGLSMAQDRAYQLTLEQIREDFSIVIEEDDFIKEMIADWNEFVEMSGYEAEEIKDYILKDMIIELLVRLKTKELQIDNYSDN